MSNRGELLRQMIQEPVHLAWDPSRQRMVGSTADNGVSLQALATDRKYAEASKPYLWVPNVQRAEALLAVNETRFTSSVERIQKILTIDESYLNRTPNYANRPAGSKIEYFIYHTTIFPGDNPYKPLNYGLSKAAGVSWTWLLPRVTVPDAQDHQVWKMFRYLSDDKIAFHAGKGYRKDPVTGKEYVNTMNQYSVGVEVDNNGKVPIVQEQFDMLVYLTMMYHHNHRVRWENFIDHKDWAPGRKFDPQPICYLSSNVRAEAKRLYSQFFGNDWQGNPNPEPEFTKWQTRSDGYNSFVRQEYQRLGAIALTLPQASPVQTKERYTDGVLIGGSKVWYHVMKAQLAGKVYVEPGFMHASRLAALTHPNSQVVRPATELVAQVATRMATLEIPRRVLHLPETDTISFDPLGNLKDCC